MKNEVGVMLRVSGDLAGVQAFHEATAQLQGKLGVRKPEHARSSLPEAWWYLEIRLADQECTAPAFLRLVDTIASNAEVLATAMERGRLLVEIDCTVKGAEGVRMEVPLACISLAADISASISFDLY